MAELTREKALIFRITHLSNLPWILENGIHCRSSELFDPAYRGIGNAELIQKRSTRIVPIAPGGTLSDYVPFYFTSRTPMLYNIKTGRNVPAVPMFEIAILVTSLPRLANAGINFLFTDRHAYLKTATFCNELSQLDRLDWAILASSDFKYDATDPGKMDRYQAEALVYQQLPMSAVAGIVCQRSAEKAQVLDWVAQSAAPDVKVFANSSYFF